jgi:dTDP-4-amino-4,6-dideoxygalactose transaminase
MFTSEVVEAFEEEFANLVGAKHAILVNSCTTAIHAAILAMDVEPGSYIGVPAFTYIGTCMPVLMAGCQPVLVDIEEQSQSIDPLSLEATFQTYPLRAVIQAHLFGAMGNAAAVHEICERYGAAVIHDCAQFLGNHNATSSLCRQGPCCFSLGESKILRVGEGGVIATNDSEMAEKVRLVRHEGELWLRHGQSRVTGWQPTCQDVLDGLASVRIGTNYRPLAIVAAMGRAKLGGLGGFLKKTRENAERLLQGLAGIDALSLPTEADRTWWTLPVTLREGIDRNIVLAALLAEGIPVGVHFPRLLSEHPGLRERVKTPGAGLTRGSRFAKQHIVLPIYPAIEEKHTDAIICAVRKVLNEATNDLSLARDRATVYLAETRVGCLCSGLFLFTESGT